MATAGSRRQRSSDGSDDEDARDRRAAEVKRVKLEKNGITAKEESSDLDLSDNADTVMESDESSDESEGEEPAFDDDELIRAYNQAKKRQKNYVGQMSEAGILKSISLVDFMCHRHLTVDFGPKMNFLIGNNGSGKSAVLTAIAIALGGKAAATGRAQGLKGLIRKGADKAVVTLVMANSGEGAFRPDLYSPYIVIERTISSNGSASYRFRATKDGKVLATKRTELTAISDFFNINIDSPLTVLTQDMSRSFLQAADPGKLYKFFLDGTQLSTLLDTYESSTQNIKQLDNTIKRQGESLPDYRAKLEKTKRKVDAGKKVITQKARNKQLLDELAWAYVTEKEADRDSAQQKVQDIEEKIELAEAEIHKIDKLLPGLQDKIKENEEDINALDNSLKPFKQEVKNAKAQLGEAKKELTSMKSTHRGLQDDIASERRTLQNVEQNIEAKLRRNEPAMQAERERLIARRTKIEGIISRMQLEKPTLKQKQEEAYSAQQAVKAEIDDLRVQMDEARMTATRCKEHIANLNRQTGDRLSAFGTKIGALMRDIESTQWRGHTPIGPLGMYVKLTDMRYRTVMHVMLGQIMCAFLVSDHQDRTKLSAMLKRHYSNGYRPGSDPSPKGRLPAVYTHSGDLFDFSSGDRRSLGETVLSKLEISRPEVVRLLITINSIEKVFLAPDINVANNKMQELLQSGVVPHCTFHCADGLTTSGSLSGKQSGPMAKWKGNTLFANDLRTDIQQAEQQYAQYDAQVGEIRARMQEAQGRERAISAELQNIFNKIGKITHDLNPMERDLDQTKRKLSEMVSEDVETSESLREEIRQKIQEMEAHIQGYELDINKQVKVVEECQAEIDRKNAEVVSYGPRREAIRALLASLVTEHSQQKANQLYFTKKQTETERNLEAARQKLATAEADLENFTGMATKWQPERVPTNRPSAVIKREKDSLDKVISAAQESLGFDLDDLMAEYKTQKNFYRDAFKNLEDLKSMHKLLVHAMKTRHAWWADTRSHTAIRAKTAFVVFESLRNLEGRLEFDHTMETLTLKVQNTVRKAAEDGTMTQTSHLTSAKGLSGGERSFSTVSLLLSLWSTTPCPLRALDEWDVFLDNANRKVAAKCLMEGAKASDKKQYILITPQNMAGIDTSGEDKRVIRLADPERNQ
ncbi:hypothetical protein IAT38_005161 [Cryptococcus sp. DSM 104549]